MSKSNLLCLGAALFGITMGGMTEALADIPQKGGGRPNIVLIMADDMGKECLGAYGGTYSTPRLDELAQKGVRFNYAFSQPLCTPSRVQIMTGRYNYKNYTRFGVLERGEKTFAHLARQAGYRTAIIGKWQLGSAADLPDHFGFDEYCLWQLSYPRSKGERYAKPLIQQNGNTLQTTDDHYGPDIFADYLLKFIEKNKDRPFFAYYPMALVHDPFLPTPESGHRWADTLLKHKHDVANFPDMVSYCDQVVGRVIDKLTELELMENTLIIFTGDNGTAQSVTTKMKDGTFIKGGKGTTKDNGTRVPLIAYWGQYNNIEHESDNLVDFTDFLPTLADALHLPVPQSWDTDGVSFLPVVQGNRQRQERKWVFCHYQPKHSERLDRESARFFRTHRYKLYQDGRFYDVASDPLEQEPISIGKGSKEAEQVRDVLWRNMQKLPDWSLGN